MLFSRKFLTLSALLLILIIVNTHLLADDQAEEVPIIATVDDDVYAVSPLTGESRLLIERSESQGFSEAGFGTEVSLISVSPDNTRLAYTAYPYEMGDAAYKLKRGDIANIMPNDITIVDIATGEQTLLTSQGENFAELFESDKLTKFSHLTWSTDGQRLYFVSTVMSMRNRAPQRAIEYYDVQAAQRQVLTKYDPHAYIDQFFVFDQSILLIGGDVLVGNYEFTVFSTATGEQISAYSIEEFMGLCGHGQMFNMNPLRVQGAYHYGYYDPLATQPGAVLMDVATQEITPLEGELFPAEMSHTHPETSMRLVHAGVCEHSRTENWVVTDAEGHRLTAITLPWNIARWQMALSPDGSALAMLQIPQKSSYNDPPAPIVIVDANGTRELNFAADSIMWGASDYTFSPLIEPAD